MDPALQALATMLKQTQGRRVEENRPATPSVTIRPTASPLPSFQQPGGMLPGMDQYMKARPAAQPAAALPPAAVPTPPPGNEPMTALPPPVNVGNAPNFQPVPQTNDQLQQWRQLMDSLQAARQGS